MFGNCSLRLSWKKTHLRKSWRAQAKRSVMAISQCHAPRIGKLTASKAIWKVSSAFQKILKPCCPNVRDAKEVTQSFARVRFIKGVKVMKMVSFAVSPHLILRRSIQREFCRRLFTNLASWCTVLVFSAAPAGL